MTAGSRPQGLIMIYDVVVYHSGTGGSITNEIEIQTLPDDAPPPVNSPYMSTFRFYNYADAQNCARNYGTNL